MTQPPREVESYLSENETHKKKVKINMDPSQQQQQQQSPQQPAVVTRRTSVEQRQPVASTIDAASSVRTDNAVVTPKAAEPMRTTEAPTHVAAAAVAPAQKPPMHPPLKEVVSPKVVKIVPEAIQEQVVAKKVGRFKVLAKTANLVPAGEVVVAPTVGSPAAPAASSSPPVGVVRSISVASSNGSPPENAGEPLKIPAAVAALTPGSSGGSSAAASSTPNSSPLGPGGGNTAAAQPAVPQKKGRFVVLPPGTAAPAAPQPSPLADTSAEPTPRTSPAASHPVQVVPTQQQQQRLPQTAVSPMVTVSKTATQAPGSAPAAEAVVRPAPEKTHKRGSSLTKAPASFDVKGVPSQQGLGKVFYFLDQMRLEVTDADKTIKTLQSEVKAFKEKNKELEARAREMERRWTEEKTAREAAETRVRTLRKKVKELKELPAAEGIDSVPHSRANSLDSVDDLVDSKKGEASPKRSPTQQAGAAAKLTTISSNDTSSLAEKQEMMDLRIDLNTKLAPSAEPANKVADKPESADTAKKQASPVKQQASPAKHAPTEANQKTHRKTESLGVDGSDMLSPHRRRVSSEHNVEVLLGKSASAPASPTETNSAKSQQPQPSSVSQAGETNQGAVPASGLSATQAKSTPNLSQALHANASAALGATPKPENALQYTKSTPNIMLVENGMVPGAGTMNNSASNIGANMSMMSQPQQQQPMMNLAQQQQQPQTIPMGHVQMQGGIPTQQMNQSTSWNQNPLHAQHPIPRQHSTGHIQFHQQQTQQQLTPMMNGTPQQQQATPQMNPAMNVPLSQQPQQATPLVNPMMNAPMAQQQQQQQPQMNPMLNGPHTQQPQQQQQLTPQGNPMMNGPPGQQAPPQQQPQMNPMLNGPLAQQPQKQLTPQVNNPMLNGPPAQQPPPPQQQQQPPMNPMMNGPTPQQMNPMMNGGGQLAPQKQQQFHPDHLQQPVLGGQQQQQPFPQKVHANGTGPPQDSDEFTKFVSERAPEN